MKKVTHHIDNFVHKNLDGLGELPPVHIWGAVENALNDHEAGVKNKREKKNRYAFMLLLLMITASAGIFWLLTSEGEAISLQALEIIQKNDDIADLKPHHSVLTINRKSQADTDDQPLVAFLSKKQDAARPGADHISEVSGIDHMPLNEQPIAFTEQNILSVNEAPQTLPIENSYRLTVNSNSMVAQSSVTNFKPVQKTRAHRLSLTAFFAPDITTRNLEQDGGSTRDEGKQEMVETEKNGVLDFTFGARIDYRLSKHFSLQSGISFSTNTIDIAQKTVYARYDKAGILRYRFNMSSGYCFFKLKNIPPPQFAGDSARTEGSNSTLHYINIPLIVKYNFPVNRRLDLTVQAGVVARFIAWESISTTYDYFGFKERSISRQIEGLKKSYFNGVVGIGAEYALNQKVALTIFPSFNFATSSINKDAPVKAYPNTLSIATGVKFNF